jgi:hypothetical protein
MSLAMACRRSEAKWMQRDKTKFWATRWVPAQVELRGNGGALGLEPAAHQT